MKIFEIFTMNKSTKAGNWYSRRWWNSVF